MENFFNSLDTIDIVLLCTGFIVLIIVVGLAIYLFKKNKQLVLMVKIQKEELDKNNKLIEEHRVKTKEFRDKLVEIKKESEKNEINEVKEHPIAKENKRLYQTSPIEVTKNKEKHDNLNYTQAIAKQMEKEIKPQTIELTDFEKKQEQEAIISYQELLSNKDKLYQITDDEETTDFIEELKSFRSEL